MKVSSRVTLVPVSLTRPSVMRPPALRVVPTVRWAALRASPAELGVFEIKGFADSGGSEADLAVGHQFRCPDVVADGGLAELEDAAAVDAKVGSGEEDSASDLGAQLGMFVDTPADEPPSSPPNGTRRCPHSACAGRHGSRRGYGGSLRSGF